MDRGPDATKSGVKPTCTPCYMTVRKQPECLKVFMPKIGSKS